MPQNNQKIFDDEAQNALDRLSKYLVLLDVYFELISENIKHERAGTWIPIMMELVYSYFYSIIEEEGHSINVFRVWKQNYPEHIQEIERVEGNINNYAKLFRDYRNTIGFHGSTKAKGVKLGEKLLEQTKGDELMEVILSVRNLSTHLLSLRHEDKARFPKYECSICN